jgi:hypothetical protein
MIVIPKSLIQSAERVASDAVGQVIEAIQAERMQVHDNPVYWYHFHRAVLQGMTPRRRKVAWWHRKRMRLAHAAMVASKAIMVACAMKGISCPASV